MDYALRAKGFIKVQILSLWSLIEEILTHSLSIGRNNSVLIKAYVLKVLSSYISIFTSYICYICHLLTWSNLNYTIFNKESLPELVWTDLLENRFIKRTLFNWRNRRTLESANEDWFKSCPKYFYYFQAVIF